MKLLLDENLSPRLARSLGDVFPGSRHVDECALGAASDVLIWEYAKLNGFAIVSKDSDFAEMSALEGAPPKVIWVRAGNLKTAHIEMLIRSHSEKIREILAEPDRPFLVIGKKPRQRAENP